MLKYFVIYNLNIYIYTYNIPCKYLSNTATIIYNYDILCIQSGYWLMKKQIIFLTKILFLYVVVKCLLNRHQQCQVYNLTIFKNQVQK